jgi:hypothetical protein
MVLQKINYIYKFSKRGLCSQLNSLCGLFEEHKLQDKGQIYINTGNSPYFKKIFFYDIFNTNCIFTNNKSYTAVVVEEKHARQFASKQYKPKTIEALSYTDTFKNEIDYQISKINLPKKFFCFHIRRGDKILEKPYNLNIMESSRFEFSDYFDKIKHLKDINLIFIMTDDYRVIIETKQYLQKHNLSYNIAYLTNNSKDGHSTDLDYKQNREYSKEEITTFFTEIEIAKLSSYFVGTQSSNVYRYIRNTCTTKTTFISLD